MLTCWRVGLHLPQALTPGDMPQNGATETARLSPDDVQLTLTTLLEQLLHDTAAPATDRQLGLW